MQVTIDRLPKNQVKIRIEVQPEEVQPELIAAASRLSSRTTFPGFRSGKAPYEVVAKRFGEAAVWEEASEAVVRRHFVAAVKQHGLQTIGHPHVSVEKIAPGNPLVFTATVALLPMVELIASKDISVDRPPVTVSDEDVAKAIEELRSATASEKPVERPAQSGDAAIVDVDVFVDGVAIEGGKSRNHPVTLGSGSFIPGFEDQVAGMTKGQTKEVTLTFPKDYHAKHLAGKLAAFKVTAQAVRERQLPPLDDAFAQRVAQAATVDQLRSDVRRRLTEQRQERAEQDFEVKLLEQLVQRSKFGDIPDMLTEHELDRMVAEIKHDVEHRGMKWPDYLLSMKRDEGSLRKDLTAGAVNRVKTSLAIRASVRQANLSVKNEEITAEVERLRQAGQDMGGVNPDDVRGYIETVLLNRKAIQHIKTQLLPAA
ncbi:MAG: trigger factor [Candidatus Kerfeldbacteria bacterium]|nr:trigger factor [Candidatus Kerfeldbacteria bacterium]